MCHAPARRLLRGCGPIHLPPRIDGNGTGIGIGIGHGAASSYEPANALSSSPRPRLNPHRPLPPCLSLLCSATLNLCASKHHPSTPPPPSLSAMSSSYGFSTYRPVRPAGGSAKGLSPPQSQEKRRITAVACLSCQKKRCKVRAFTPDTTTPCIRLNTKASATGNGLAAPRAPPLVIHPNASTRQEATKAGRKP